MHLNNFYGFGHEMFVYLKYGSCYKRFGNKFNHTIINVSTTTSLVFKLHSDPRNNPKTKLRQKLRLGFWRTSHTRHCWHGMLLVQVSRVIEGRHAQGVSRGPKNKLTRVGQPNFLWHFQYPDNCSVDRRYLLQNTSVFCHHPLPLVVAAAKHLPASSPNLCHLEAWRCSSLRWIEKYTIIKKRSATAENTNDVYKKYV